MGYLWLSLGDFQEKISSPSFNRVIEFLLAEGGPDAQITSARAGGHSAILRKPHRAGSEEVG
jgi:hypothetical protein